jgi:hypothetical protein
VVQNVLVTDPGTEALICFEDSSSVIVKDGNFTDWHSPKEDTFVALKVTSSSASLVISNTKFYREPQPEEVDGIVGPFGGALMAVAGKTTIVSSTFAGGHTVQGGTIVATGQAQVDIGSYATGEGPQCFSCCAGSSSSRLHT